VWIQIRKGQLQGRKVLAKDVNYKPNLEKILKSDIGYIDLKKNRTSLDYFEHINKNVFVMIRQLGPPNFFIIFTSEDHQSHELVCALKYLYRNKRNEKNYETLEDKDINYLIRKDPITFTHYHKHRIISLRQLISHEKIFFTKVSDSYFVK